MGREHLLQERDYVFMCQVWGPETSIGQCISLSIKRIAFLLDHIKLFIGKIKMAFKFFTSCDRIAMAHPKNGLEMVND